MWLIDFIPFKKEILIALGIIAAVYLFGSTCYNKGVASVQLEQKLSELKSKNDDLAKQLIAANGTVRIVTEYKDRIIEVDKKVPVYVTKIQQIFAYNDNIIIPSDLARLHNISVAGGDPNAFTPTGPNDPGTRAVTLGEFSSKVMENYSICKKNSVQLTSLQDWIKMEGLVYNKK